MKPWMRRTQIHVLTALFAAALLTSPAAAATAYDGRYTGVFQCDTIPGQTTIPLRVAFSLKIVDGRIQYERDVLQADSSKPSGSIERGSGTVSPRGEVSLTGSASGTGWKYDSAYRGQIEGTTLRLSGSQLWTFRSGTPTFTRPCTITLSRSE